MDLSLGISHFQNAFFFPGKRFLLIYQAHISVSKNIVLKFTCATPNRESWQRIFFNASFPPDNSLGNKKTFPISRGDNFVHFWVVGLLIKSRKKPWIFLVAITGFFFSDILMWTSEWLGYMLYMCLFLNIYNKQYRAIHAIMQYWEVRAYSKMV